MLLLSQVASCEEAEKLQMDLNAMHGWSVEWLKLFNEDKCKCAHKNVHTKRLGSDSNIQA